MLGGEPVAIAVDGLHLQNAPNVNNNPWLIIHTRLAAAIESGLWDETAERKWYQSKFVPLIPKSCCSDNWGPIEAKLNWSTAEAAFESWYQAHNEVSLKHSGRPTITFEQCRALYLQQPSLDDCCLAVTSLAPNRFDRQSVCLDSWKQVGLTICAVQPASEIESLRTAYPQVTHWHPVDESQPPKIHQLAQIAVDQNTTALIINADIEIHGQQLLIRNAIASGMLVGIRYNYESDWWQGTREPWGIDVFGITPEIAQTLPDLELRIGRPMWDYWLPHHAKLHQFPMSWINEPLFFHRSHSLAWTQEDWQQGAKVFCQYYGVDIATDWAKYRHGLSGAQSCEDDSDRDN